MTQVTTSDSRTSCGGGRDVRTGTQVTPRDSRSSEPSSHLGIVGPFLKWRPACTQRVDPEDAKTKRMQLFASTLRRPTSARHRIRKRAAHSKAHAGTQSKAWATMQTTLRARLEPISGPCPQPWEKSKFATIPRWMPSSVSCGRSLAGTVFVVSLRSTTWGCISGAIRECGCKGLKSGHKQILVRPQLTSIHNQT
jgi:hypothetical protein